MFKTIRRLLFFVFLFTFLLSFLLRKSYRVVDEIEPEVKLEPRQVELESKDKIVFEKDSYKYELTPVFDYEINGLIVHTFNYSFLGIYDTGNLFPVDLCMIWGSNVSSQVYKDKSLNFSQDYRWCNYSWKGDIEFNSHEVSNNHLLIIDDEMEEIAKSLDPGDQVRIVGKLVDVKGEKISMNSEDKPEIISWKTSVSREDSGAGGCEVIYVESLGVLERAHVVTNVFQSYSLIGMLVLFLFNIFLFIKETHF